ncbi:MAG TPA: hypothetical protein VMD59_00995 [Acidimicrobiales bacterium]|nr:hypothetical protein [Acidimicrobiales bacterium]
MSRAIAAQLATSGSDHVFLDATMIDSFAQVECDRLEQVAEAVEAGASLVLCDNLTPDEVRRSVEFVRGHPRGAAGAVLVEASGNITLDTVADYAVRADVISSGALTHSAPALDIGLDLL